MSEPRPPAPAPIPEDNLPGHHPEVEQDKPKGPPPKRKLHHLKQPLRRREMFALTSHLFGVTDENGYVEVDEDKLEIHFGPWQLETPLSNIVSAEVTGPFEWWKVIGPPHVSLRDRGVTFATTNRGGVCIKFREPVKAVDPVGLLKHPGVTVTVTEPEALVEFLQKRVAA
ncbi:MAG TPA: hypothetical protein VHD87_04340 [Acidimicrobiales bacterium]|nr:hypothetical protein [Acidimicrobiales bacterium]